MKIEEIEKLCEGAIEACFAFKVSRAQYEFYKNCHEMVPKLIAVAKAAKQCREFSKTPILSPMKMIEGDELLQALEQALEDLEKE